MFRRATADRLRGCAVGATAGVLAIAAHGVGGGGHPSAAAGTLLAAICAMSGAAAGTARGRNPGTLLALLVCAQSIGHIMLSAVNDAPHVHHTPALMFAAHAVATLACGVLIIIGDRLIAGLSRLVGVVTTTYRVPVRQPAQRIRPRSTLAARTLVRDCITPRGPPLVCATP